MNVMNQEQTARYLGLSVPMVCKYTREGRIPHKRLGNRLLYTQEQIDEWLLEREEVHHETA